MPSLFRSPAVLVVLLACLAPAPMSATEPLTLTKKTLSLAAARLASNAAEAEARTRSVGVVIVVVDAGGHVMTLTRMDTAQVASVDVGIGKARTAAIYRRPSRVFEEQIRNGRIAALALAGATPLQGGVPISIDGEVIGAVGVSGDTPQVDEDIAIAGVNAIVAAMSVGRSRDENATAGAIERFDPRLDALVPHEATLEQIVDGLEWAEGPVWDPAGNSLLFSDVPRNAVYRAARTGSGTGVQPTLYLARSGYTGNAPFDGREPGSNGLTFDSRGRLVLAQHGDRRIARREEDGRLTVIADRFDGRRFNSPNDLVYHSSGDLYFTDPPFGLPRTFQDPNKELPFQGVYRVASDGTVDLLVHDLEAPNGIAFSPDEKTLYVSNASAARPVWMAYDVNGDGTLANGRQFADASPWIAESEGLPDGIKVDERGHVYAAGPGGIHIFAPDGTRLGRIRTGVPTGNLAWGDDGRALYVAANHRIYRLRTNTRGFVANTSRRRQR